MSKIKYDDLKLDIQDQFDFLILFSDDVDEIKEYIMKYNIDVNNYDILKTICSKNNDKLFYMFLDDLNANFAMEDYGILKYYSFIGDVDKLKFLLTTCKIDINDFVKCCKESTLSNSKKTRDFINTIVPIQ